MLDKVLSKSFKTLFNTREKLTPGFPALEFALVSDRYKRWLYKANYLSVRGEIKEAVDQFIRILKVRPNDRIVHINLSYLIAQSSDEKLAEYTLNKLEGIGGDIDQDDHLARTQIELRFMLDEQDGLSAADRYIDQILIPDKRGEVPSGHKPIFFWHIPKCAGTSINRYFSSYYYKSNLELFPGYHTPLFLKYIIEKRAGLFPYVSSAHMRLAHLDGSQIEDNYYQVAIIRDPMSRSVSSWRQYYHDPLRRLNVLQQHGSHWDYWPGANLGEWVERAPESHINYLCSTFSGSIDENEALSYAKNIDCAGNFKQVNACLKAICDLYGLNFDVSQIPTKLNSTNKQLSYSDHDMSLLKQSLNKDLKFYDLFEKHQEQVGNQLFVG